MQRERGREANRRGFALLVVVVLLGSLVIFAWGLAGMLRISHALAAAEEEGMQSRQAAWNAAMQGLARLQEWMGEDRRSSATAAYLGEEDAGRLLSGIDVRNAQWIGEGEPGVFQFDAENLVSGVWDQTGQFLGWLGLRGRSGVWREMVPGVELQLHQGDPSRKISVGEEDIALPDHESRWLYGYWIAEEGVKASIQAWQGGYSADQNEHTTSPDWDKIAPERLYDPVQSVEAFMGNHHHESSAAMGYEELLERQQLLFRDRDYEQGVVTWRGSPYDLTIAEERQVLLRELFHSTTLLHTGLLTQPLKGGMKENLLDATKEPLNRWLSNRSHPDPQYGFLMEVNEETFPVLTSLKLQFMLIRKESRVYLRQRLFARWWNPYTSTLVFPESVRMAVEITGLPEWVKVYRNEQLWETVRLADLVTHSHPGGQPHSMKIGFPFPETFWFPGRTWHWAGIHPEQGEAFFHAPNMTNATYQRDYPLDVWIYPEYDLPGTHYELEYAGTSQEYAGIEVRMGIEERGEWTPTQVLTGELGGMEFEEGWIGPGPLEELIPDRPAGGEVHVGYRIRMYESGYYTAEASAAQRGDWLQRDIRDRQLIASSGVSGHYEYYPDSTAYQSIQSEVGLEGPDFRRLDTRPLTGPNALRTSMDFPLFEHIWDTPFTLASLQHHAREGQAPYSLGNPWGGEVNAWFDEVFIENGHEEWGDASNPFLRRVESGEPGESRSVIKGAFNVNSVHTGAWHSLLMTALQPDWWYWEKGDQGQWGHRVETRLEYPFFRFPQSAAAVFQLGMKTAAQTTLQDIPPREYFLRGVREFSRLQIARLAEQVVSQIKDYHRGEGHYAGRGGRPFASIQEFVNAGILHHAIERSGLNHLQAVEEWREENPKTVQEKRERDDPYAQNFGNQRYDSSPVEIWHRTPFHLSQADVLAAIDPSLTVRSDTWLIRGYAEKHPQGSSGTWDEPRSRAMVEVWVQRVYDIQKSAGLPYQRRFRIIGVRWL